MMKKILLVMMLVWIAGCKKENPLSTTDEAQLYFPLAKGNIWIYDVSEGFIVSPAAYQEYTYSDTLRIDSITVTDTLQWYETERFFLPVFFSAGAGAGGCLYCGSLSSIENKVLAITFQVPDGRLRWQVTLLDAPLTVGKQWNSRLIDTIMAYEKIHIIQKIKRFVRGFESVSVPAGQFQCVHIEDSTIISTSPTEPLFCRSCDSSVVITNEWYALGVGMVKQSIVGNYFSSDGSLRQYINRTSVLRSFEIK